MTNGLLDEPQENEEQNEKKSINNIINSKKSWITSNNGRRITRTVSVFLIAILINVFSKGIRVGFSDFTSLFDFQAYLIGLVGGIGTFLTQNDAIDAADSKVEAEDEKWIEVQTEVIDEQDKVEDIKYARTFAKNLTKETYVQACEEATDNKINAYEIKIADMEETPPVTLWKYINWILFIPHKIYSSRLSKIKRKYEYVKVNGAKPKNFKPFKYSDLFTFSVKTRVVGSDSVDTDSKKYHKKRIGLKKFITPVFTNMGIGLISRFYGASFSEIASFIVIYIALILYIYFKTYSDQIDIKTKIMLPRLKNKRKYLKRANDEYDDWKAEEKEAMVELEKESHIKMLDARFKGAISKRDALDDLVPSPVKYDYVYLTREKKFIYYNGISWANSDEINKDTYNFIKEEK